MISGITPRLSLSVLCNSNFPFAAAPPTSAKPSSIYPEMSSSKLPPLLAFHLGFWAPGRPFWSKFSGTSLCRIISAQRSPRTAGFVRDAPSWLCACAIWDAYQSAFAPSAIPSSYNLELLARDVGSLLRGQLVMEEFYNLWALCLDPEKTYYWATNSKDRSFLRQLGHRVELAHADLGGALTFCRSRALGSFRARLDSLEPLWSKLRRSSSPAAIKQLILRQAFWPKALHAVSISLLPWAEIAQLRTNTVRALGHGKAGAHPGIRLGLLSGTRSLPAHQGLP